MDIDTIPAHLSEQREAAPADLQHYYVTFEDYWERKLWHELTDSLLEYYRQDGSASQRIPLFNTFIKSFADKINKLKLVELGLAAATQCRGMEAGILMLLLPKIYRSIVEIS
jgi:26S proteasome regulatory subunit N9